MEKRLFLAILLSFGVLYGWSALLPKPKISDQKQPFFAEDVKKDDQGSTSQRVPDASSPAVLGTEKQPPSPVPPQREDVFTHIETDKIKVKFRYIGGAIDEVSLKEYQTALPISGVVNLFGYEEKKFDLVRKTDQEIEYAFEDELVKITKIYNIDNYNIKLKVNIDKNSENARMDNLLFKIYSIKMSNLNLIGKNDQFFMRDRSLFEYVIASKEEVLRKGSAFQFTAKERTQKQTDVKWIGFRDRYFCAIIKPIFTSSGFTVNPIDKERLDIEIGTTAISQKHEFLMFFGPEDVVLLGKTDNSFKEIKRYYRNDLFDAVAKFIDFIMRNIYKIVPNWGLAIILIGLVVYFSMYPLTLQSFASMRKMQKMQPKIADLKEKYKSNPQKMNQEMMAIYKEEKINPLGGCLPLLLQMPVFIGLYQVLWRNVSLKGAKFLWIRDLSEPDRIFTFKQSLPFIGNEFNILPFLMIFVMFVQQKISTKAMLVTDPDQLAQQKMMAIVFPIMLGFVFYHMASGLNLYFTMFYMLSAFTQWKMTKQS